MRSIHLALERQPSEIYIEQEGLQKLPALLRKHRISGELAVISDDRVAKLYGATLLDLLAAAGIKAPLFQVPEGEGSKSLYQCEQLYRQLILGRFSRGAVIVALGGGVVGDLAGFVAATYLRGVRLVQLPTTLLAQVDSSVGGKTGVNHALGKNLIGAFHQPEIVCIDPTVLATLPRRERLAGMGEVVKYALIRDRLFFETLSRHLETLLELGDLSLLEKVIENCCSIKAVIVSGDEREKGSRALLNFGHTIGHALEAAGQYECFRHGEAVTRGMAAAIFLSQQLGHISAEEAREALTLLDRLAPPQPPEDMLIEAVMPFLEQDKKRLSSGQSWVLLRGLGNGFITGDVPAELVPEAIRFACRASWTNVEAL